MREAAQMSDCVRISIDCGISEERCICATRIEAVTTSLESRDLVSVDCR